MGKEKIILLVAILGGFAFLIVITVIKYKVEVLNRPEQHEQVVVVNLSRKSRTQVGGKKCQNMYSVTFK